MSMSDIPNLDSEDLDDLMDCGEIVDGDGVLEWTREGGEL